MTKQEDTAHKCELTLMEESSFLISCQSPQADELAGSRLSLKSSCTVHFDLVKWEVATDSKKNVRLLSSVIGDLRETVKSKIEINVSFKENFVFECRRTFVLFHFIFSCHLGLLLCFTWKMIDWSWQGNSRIFTLLNCPDRLSHLVMVTSFLV